MTAKLLRHHLCTSKQHGQKTDTHSRRPNRRPRTILSHAQTIGLRHFRGNIRIGSHRPSYRRASRTNFYGSRITWYQRIRSNSASESKSSYQGHTGDCSHRVQLRSRTSKASYRGWRSRGLPKTYRSENSKADCSSIFNTRQAVGNQTCSSSSVIYRWSEIKVPKGLSIASWSNPGVDDTGRGRRDLLLQI